MVDERSKDPTLSAFAVRKLGRYELLTQIGKGGMAEVHLAMQRGPGGFEKLVVIKLIHDHMANKPEFVEMLLDEGRLAGMIKHPNVIDIYDLGEAEGRYFVAMEYLDGEPLLAVLRRGVEGERLDPLSTARVIADTAEGLEATHRLKSHDGQPLGLIHHDVSLGNIVVLSTGAVKLVDFGVAKARTGGRHAFVQGKFGYMAPEKLEEGREVDRRSDIWSLGVVAWEALTLQRLFKGKTDAETMKMVVELEVPAPSTINPEIPSDFDPIILRALARDPEKRYATAKSFALDLEGVLRKCGYAGKNDRIASYMERAFAAQLSVRERLVAELSAGRTSKATIDAVRNAASTGPATPVPGMITREVSDGIPSHPDLRAADAQERGDASVARRRESIRDLQEWVDDERRRRALPWWQRYAPWLAGAAVLLVLVLIVVRCSGTDVPRRGASTQPDQPVIVVAVDAAIVDPAVVAVDAAESVSDDAEVGTAIELAIEPTDEPEPTPKPPPTKPPPKPLRPTTGAGSATPPPIDRSVPRTAEALTRLGFEQLRRSDNKAAFESLSQATKLNASYAPGWYGLGRAYEAVGSRRGPPVSAYQRYLSLAPSGPYAADARARVKQL